MPHILFDGCKTPRRNRGAKEKYHGKAHVTRSHEDGKARAGFGKQTPPLRGRTRRSDSRDRPYLPSPPDGSVTGGPPYRKFSLPRANRIGKDSNRRGNSSGPAERSPGGDQDRLRRVST